jgi:glycine cleavage system regulatory protein
MTASHPFWTQKILNCSLDTFLSVAAKRKRYALCDSRQLSALPSHGILLEWKDAVQYQHSAEKEWLYLRGVKDGMGMIKQVKHYLKHHRLEI